MTTRKMKKATGKVGYMEKKKRDGSLAVSLIVILQILGWVCFSMTAAIPAEAVTLTVNSTMDESDTNPGNGVCLSESGFCTLRAAIEEANALPGADVIKLQAGLYMLNMQRFNGLVITDSLTITGKGAKNTFINGDRNDRVFHIKSLGVTGPLVKIGDMTIQNGSKDFGGGILNDLNSTLYLQGISLSNNTATSMGGGIYNSGTLLAITKSTLFNNGVRGDDGVSGGAIVNDGGRVLIKSGMISNNSVVARNGNGYGGGILNLPGGVLEIERSTISSNTVWVSANHAQGGGICNNGTLTISQSTISNNMVWGPNWAEGGGIQSFAIPQGQGQMVTITRSVISNNVARGFIAEGGGICGFGGDITLTGSTVSYNAANGFSAGHGIGGGIRFKNGELMLMSGTKILYNFSTEDGGGTYLDNAGIGVSEDSKIEKNMPNDMVP